ncbi:acyl-CoA dehydrogenase family protein [Yinghuangia seranimata]|uniref:acyl-CoA dehydrogenase family protein n=1 Tax=Yinghuangia seranimata TaxID=408067 RepID=UPI00248CF054|nr:acyl-CoA dehydrogenase family protein [Yinghuangia seranimata]MDI2130317.1 acyl-CoA dehydrogenase family protein [Yinghuangia seranimata]
MDVEFSEEQQEIRRALRDALDKAADSPAVRAAMATEHGYDPKVWRRLCEQTGLAGLGIPEEYGGVGFTFTEVVIALEEMGRTLFPSPFLGSAVLAASALVHGGDEAARAEYLPGMAEGATIATLALAEPGARDVTEVSVTATATSTGEYRLDGVKTHVIDGALADLVLVAARLDGEVALFAVAADAAGLTRAALPVLDQTRRQARLDFSDTPARLIGAPGAQAEAALERVRQLTEIAIAAESVGGAARCLDMTVEYSKIRVQFGRAIGSFQAIKHRCADMYVQLETSRSALYYAAWAATEAEAVGLDVDPAAPGAGELALMAPLAMTTATAAYRAIAEETIQLHGGVGFTWEHDAHLYLKRATTSALLFGRRTAQRERIAALAGI